MSGTNTPAAKLLIVEDILFPDAEDLKGQLAAHGYEITGIARSTKEAVELARLQKPDLVLMDLKIPLEHGEIENRQGGIIAAKEIQRIGDISIVYITAEPPTEDILQAVKKVSPDAMYITKPYREEQVVAAVGLALMKTRGNKVVFLCYSHAIDKSRVELLKFLEPLKRFGIVAWHDKQIKAGAYWHQVIAEAVTRADVAILLISIDFVNSLFITEFELPNLLKAAAERGVAVIPVFVSFVPKQVLKQLGLLDFSGINDPEKPLDTLTGKQRAQQAWGPLCDQLLASLSGRSPE